MSRAEVDELMGWAAAEGWAPGLGDADALWRADPGGFLAARVGGRMVAGIAAVHSGPDFAFLGAFICLPEWRGQRIGARLIRWALESCGDRVVGLDGVPEQVPFYRRLGFVAVYDEVRYRSGGGALAPRSNVTPDGVRLVPGSDSVRVAAVAFDAGFFPGDRSAFMAGWLGGPREWWVAVDAHDQVVGLGAIRVAPPVLKVGPLHARTPQVAAALLAALVGQRPDPVILSVPGANQAALDLFDGLGMTRLGTDARMYRGPVPALPVEGMFAICTLELG